MKYFMKLNLKYLLILISSISILIWIGLSAFLFLYDETVKSFYETKTEAVNNRLFIRGWLPDIIPNSSFDISVNNDLDLNKSKGSFSFLNKDYDSFLKNLENLPNKDRFDAKAYQYENWVFWLKQENESTYSAEYLLN